MAVYTIRYRDADFQRARTSSTEMTQQVQHDLGNNRVLIVELARSITVPDPIILRAAMYKVYIRGGKTDLRMCQTVRRNEIQLIEDVTEREYGSAGV
jgi:hypothetical protein